MLQCCWELAIFWHILTLQRKRYKGLILVFVSKTGRFACTSFPAERRNMGEPNNALSVYMNRPDRIKSVLEYYLGEKLPQDWQCEEVRGLTTLRNRKGKLSFRQRDFYGRGHAWGKDFWLGIENQDSINLIFPWRMMELDSLAYGAEIEEIQEKNSQGNVHYGIEDDFKYHYRKEDRLEPVLNLTLYWGRQEWGNPLSIGDMADIDTLPEALKGLFEDYKVHLIPMRSIPDPELEKMGSDLKYVLGLMKRTGSKKKYVEYIQKNREYFSRIPKSAVDVIDACTNIKNIREHLQFQDAQITRSGEEEADMCYALDAIIRDAEKKGKRQGARQGIDRTNRLIQLLLADGRQDDLLKSTTDTLFQQKLFREYHI